MQVERARQIAVRYVCYKNAGKLLENLPETDQASGEFALRLMKRMIFSQAIRFDGLMAEMGRLSQGTHIAQEELHECFIEYIMPFLLSEGLTATGHIYFEYSGRSK